MICRFRRVFAGLAVGLMVMAGALPAIAAQVDGIEINFRSPTPGAGTVVTGVREVRVEARSQTPAMIKDITIRVEPNSGRNTGCEAPAAQQGLCRTKNYETGPFGASEARDNEVLDFTWDTERATPLNGVYDLVSVARSDVPGVKDSTVAVVEDVMVNNPPDRPRNFSVSTPVRGQPELTLSWAKNPEPDIIGYELARAVGEGGFGEERFVGKDVTSVQDIRIPFETPVRYQLIAFRNSPVAAQGNRVASPATTTPAVIIEAPPPPPSPSPSSTPGAITASDKPKANSPKDLSQRLGSPDSASTKLVKPVSLTAPNTISGPRRDGGSGFSRLLPFGMDAPQSLVDQEFAEAVGEAIRNPGRLISEEIQLNPLRFVAAAVLLLVTAGHLGRSAQALFRSAKTSASTSSEAIPV